MHAARGCLVSLGLVASIAVSAANDVPAPRIPPGYVPEQSEDERGLWMEVREYETNLAKSPLLVRDPAINAYVKDMACRVAGAYCDDLRIYIVRNPGFNASMAPTGMMEVWTGVFTRARNDSDLATILGHETAHYTQAHSLERFRRIRSGMTAGALASLGLGVATGVLLPVGESVALLNAMAHTRAQEEEADLLGAQMMAQAGYDPHATYAVWHRLVEEEAHAVDKDDGDGYFLRSHPEGAAREVVLRDFVEARYGASDPAASNQNGLLPLLEANYILLMTDQIKTNRYSRTELMLQWHESMGVDIALVEFIRAQMYAQRRQPGDDALVVASLQKSIATLRAPAEAYRDLAYNELKANQPVQARENFKRYLELSPDASDRAMIEFYIEEP